MNVIEFRVFGIPQTKGSTKSFYVKNLNRVVTTNDNPKNKNWALAVSQEAVRVRPPTLWMGPISLVLRFHLKKPKSLKKNAHVWHTKKPDISKITRSIEDALTGIIWGDDAQIVESSQQKFYSDAPGVEILITKLVTL